MRFFCYRQYLLELVVAVEGGFGSLAGSLSPLRTLRSARALRFRSLPPCSPSALPARAHTVSDRVSLKKVYKSLFFERPQGARVAIMCVGCVGAWGAWYAWLLGFWVRVDLHPEG